MKITQPYPALTFPHINEQLREIYQLLNGRLNADNVILKHKDTLEQTPDDHHPHANKVEIDRVTDGDHDVRTDDPHNVTKAQVGLGNVENLKVNLTATVAPVVTDDSGLGYAVSSRWVDVIADKEYVCLDASVGAAVWAETTGGAGAAKAIHGIVAMGNWIIGAGQVARILVDEVWEAVTLDNAGILAINGQLTITG